MQRAHSELQQEVSELKDANGALQCLLTATSAAATLSLAQPLESRLCKIEALLQRIWHQVQAPP